MQRIKYIDGMKGFGCLAIFFCHFRMVGFQFPDLYIFHNLFFSTLTTGDVFVCLFIMVSAYCITGSIEKNLIVPGGLQQLILKRYLRLAVPIGCVCILIVLLHYLGVQWNSVASIRNGNERLGAELSNPTCQTIPQVLFLSPFGFQGDGWFSQCWMMKYIFLGTFLNLSIVLGTENIEVSKKYLVCAFWMAIFFFVDPYYMNVIAGYMLYIYEHNKPECCEKYRSLICFFCLAMVCTFRLYFALECKDLLSLRSTAIAIPMMLLVAHSNWIRQFLSSRPMQFLGKISFSIYLLHMYILVSVSSFLYLHFTEIPEMLGQTLNILVSSMVLIVVSFLNQKYIEGLVSKNVVTNILRKLERS